MSVRLKNYTTPCTIHAQQYH